MDEEDDFPWDQVELPAGYEPPREAEQAEPAPAGRVLPRVEPLGQSTWHGHGHYMSEKVLKLHEQDQQHVAVCGCVAGPAAVVVGTLLTLAPHTRQPQEHHLRRLPRHDERPHRH